MVRSHTFKYLGILLSKKNISEYAYVDKLRGQQGFNCHLQFKQNIFYLFDHA